MITRTCLLFAVLGIAAPAAADEAADRAALAARNVFKTHCHRCHHGAGSDGGEFDVLLDASLKQASAEGDKVLVSPGKPDESYLLERIVKGHMPPKQITQRPSAPEAEIVRAWIAAGAPAYPEDKTREFVSIADVLTCIRDDLRAAAKEDRHYLRYFTLSHLHNNPSIPDDDLRIYRAGLSKAINSLSWKPRIVLPRAVDRHETVYAIDVRQLDWDKKNLWQEVAAAYPYGLRYKDHPDETLHRLDEELHEMAGCNLALVRADWFVSQATRPPLYYTLLQIPVYAQELERQLKVDIKENYRRDQLSRAGFYPSGVSGQNRLLERHEAVYGAYWKSYDFKADGARLDLKKFPLGPADVSEEYPDQAFVHDGGEIIFHLPNGLQGYMLVDGKDRRIDKGPVDVVSDSLKTSGTTEIYAGVSCIACHKHGMMSFTDQIRDGAAVFGPAQRKVKRIYPEAAAMAQLCDDDEEKFMTALEKSVGPFLQVGADADKSIREFNEPVAETARLYRLTPLDLRAVACEIGLENPFELKQEIGEKRFRELGLAPLAGEGRIDRQLWETGTGMSMMQRLAREFGYTPWEDARK